MELLKLLRALGINECEFLQLVLDNVPAGVFWKDRNSIYLGCNRNYARFCGLSSPSEIIGKSDHELGWSAADIEKHYHADDQEVMRTGKSKVAFREPLQFKDGDSFWVETTKVPLKDRTGKVFGVLGLYRIVEPCVHEQQMRANLEEAAQLSEQLKETIPAT